MKPRKRTTRAQRQVGRRHRLHVRRGGKKARQESVQTVGEVLLEAAQLVQHEEGDLHRGHDSGEQPEVRPAEPEDPVYDLHHAQRAQRRPRFHRAASPSKPATLGRRAGRAHGRRRGG